MEFFYGKIVKNKALVKHMIEYLLLGASYLVGTIMTARFVGLLHGTHIQQHGSGNAGARNAGRLLGKKAFVLTFFGDAIKGTAPVLAGKAAGFPTEWQLLMLGAAIIGHIFPVWHRFKGGKGMSTFVGGMLAFDPLLFSVFSATFAVLYAAVRSFTVAGLSAVACMPALVSFFGYSAAAAGISAVLSVLILYAHRDNMKEKLIR